MTIRDRIKELRRVRAGELRAHPQNWRTHPEAQREALRGVLEEVGYADALLARELPDGGLELIDGHLRAEMTPDTLVPVLVLDVSQSEAAKILATLDPLAALAEADAEKLDQVLRQVETGSPAVADLLSKLAGGAGLSYGQPDEGPEDDSEPNVPELFQVLAECTDEAQQKVVYEMLTARGVRCRLLTL
jgi:hypothetical protein